MKKYKYKCHFFIDQIRFKVESLSKSNMSVPTVQRAVRIYKTKDINIVAHDINSPVPEVGPTQVLLKTKYSGVNFINKYIYLGYYKATLPTIVGREGAGVVVKVGDKVTNFKKGDRAGYVEPGNCGEYVAVDANASVAKVPDNVALKDAAAALLQGLTALAFTQEAYTVQRIDTVLVHAAADDIGLLIVQVAKLIGVTVIGITCSTATAGPVRAFGADHVIVTFHENVALHVKELTNGRGVDMVFDGTGKKNYETPLKLLAHRGTLVDFGNAPNSTLPVLDFNHSVKILQPLLYVYIENPKQWSHYRNAV